MRRQNCRRDSGSTPPVGSSRKRMAGSCRIAQPSARRCRQPPARSRASWRSRPASPAISSTNRRRSASAAGQPVDAAEELDVLVDREQFVQREPLRHVADALLHASGSAADIDAADECRAGRGLEQPAEHPDSRRLARAVASEKAEDLPARHVERHVVDGNESAEPPRQVSDFNRVGTALATRLLV